MEIKRDLIVIITNAGDPDIPAGTPLKIKKIYSWGVQGQLIGENFTSETKNYYAQWDELTYQE